jgi:hypothetical protein
MRALIIVTAMAISLSTPLGEATRSRSPPFNPRELRPGSFLVQPRRFQFRVLGNNRLDYVE